jgi:hypothetical protein
VPDSQPRPPALRKGNPGTGVEAEVPTAGKGNKTEIVNAVDLLGRVLRKQGHAARRQKTWIELPESGFLLIPQVVGFRTLDGGGLHTTTTIQVHHPTLCPDGVFEYQHSWGDSVAASLSKGFDQWFQVDFIPFLDALLPSPQTCTTMEMVFPAKEGQPPYCRRALLGPVAHFQSAPARPAPSTAQAEGHPFCSCCFFTNTIAAFKDLVERLDFLAIRFFAARGEDGSPQVDCRVNGNDFGPGADALRAYVPTWPGKGYEFRKQLVLLQTTQPRTDV